MFKQIHEIVFNGQGGYDWNTVYNMPVWLRKFTFETLKDYYEKEAEKIEKQNNLIKNNATLAKPNIPKIPTYTAKAPKK